MLEIPSRSGLSTLIEAAAAAVPSRALGFTRYLDDSRVSILYCGPHGIGEFVIPGADLPDVLLPSGEGLRQADATAFHSDAVGAIEQLLHTAGVQRVASLDASRNGPAARLWIGLLDATPLSGDDFRRLEPVVEAGAALLTAPSLPEEAVERRRRLELAEGLLPSLLRVLDVRDVFDQLSIAARRALPHDLLLLFLFDEDLSQCTLFARSDRGPDSSAVLPNPYPAADRRGWAFQIVDDHASHPLERDTHATRLGARSSLRVPIRFDDRVMGGVAFVSFEPARYTSADVAIGRRLADHVAVGLSHYQLAEESRRAAAARERAASLDVLDGLMSAITDVLDVRSVFDRIFEISQQVLPHDAMSIAVPSLDGTRATLYAATGALRGLPFPSDQPLQDTSLVERAWDFVLIDDLPANPVYAPLPSVKAGMRSLVAVPVRIEGQLRAWVNFWSRTRGRFTPADVAIVRRIAAHITLTLSHQRLAEQTRRNEELRARATNLELLDELLTSLIDTGDLRHVFERICGIAQKVLPHDAASLPILLPDGRHARIHASVGVSQPPDVVEVPEDLIGNPEWEHEIVERLSGRTELHHVRMAQMGFESLLRVPVKLEGRFAGTLIFVSRTPAAFAPPDVLVARRIADRLALVVARDREVEASRRADEALARAARLESRVRVLTEELDARTGYRRVIGDSAEWRAVLTQATQVAANETTVLLLGESGTGKEVVARFVHRASPRANGPFVAVNCAALPEQLLEAELFGYERGAFTGAVQSKPGQLEQAAGGTLFLDEVGEMSLPAQAKFLRVLQEREFQRLGGTRLLRCDARIIAATNRDLERAITHNQFREDLYYRLNVFAIFLPAVRDRRSDILPLSQAFLSEIGRNIARPAAGISRDARERLLDYHWPGNVRELRNILERASILCDGGLITPEHLAIGASARPAATARVPGPAAAAVSSQSLVNQAALPPAGDLKSLERDMIEQTLQRVRFNKSRAAKDLGLTRQQLYLRMKKYGLE